MTSPSEEKVAPRYVAPERSLVIVPTYNERLNVRQLISKFFTSVDGVHLLIVDDHSPDYTADAVEELIASYPLLCVLRRQGERGLGHAYVAGILYGLEQGFDVIGTMDADLSHDPASLPAMLELLAANDLVIGSRYVRDGGTVNWKTHRILLSWFANRFAATLLGLPAHDITSGYRVYRRAALEWIRNEKVQSTGYAFLGELLYQAHRRGARIAESPIIFHDRTLGVSKLHRSEIYRGAVNLVRLRLLKR